MMDKSTQTRPGPKDTRAALVAMMKSSAPMMVLTEDAIRALVDISANAEAATEWLQCLAAKYEKPLGINLSNCTTIISPPGWTVERLRGYVAAHVAELEANFGPVVDIESKH